MRLFKCPVCDKRIISAYINGKLTRCDYNISVVASYAHLEPHTCKIRNDLIDDSLK